MADLLQIRSSEDTFPHSVYTVHTAGSVVLVWTYYREIFNCLTCPVDPSSAGPSANTRSGNNRRGNTAAMMINLMKPLCDRMRTWITSYVVDLKQVVYSLNRLLSCQQRHPYAAYTVVKA